MNRAHAEHRWVAFILIALGVVSRLAPHPPNVTPLMAIALFGGTYLSKRSAILLPFTIVVLSDAVLGWHDTVPFTWGAFLITGTLAWWVRLRPSLTRILTGALGGSLMFFLITNFGVWAVGELYPRTAAGLWQCFVAAIPFLRNTMMGDLIYAAVFFGSYALAVRSGASRHAAAPSSQA